MATAQDRGLAISVPAAEYGFEGVSQSKTTSNGKDAAEETPDPVPKPEKRRRWLAGLSVKYAPGEEDETFHPFEPMQPRQKKDSDVSLSSYAAPQQPTSLPPLPAVAPGFGTSDPSVPNGDDNMQNSADLPPMEPLPGVGEQPSSAKAIRRGGRGHA